MLKFLAGSEPGLDMRQSRHWNSLTFDYKTAIVLEDLPINSFLMINFTYISEKLFSP